MFCSVASGSVESGQNDCGQTRQFELFIFIKCVTIKLAETNYIAKKVNV